jgi:hypothetical protein
VSIFESKLSANTGVLLTADHGVLDVVAENHVYLDTFARFTDSVLTSAGDPRCNFLYLCDGVDSAEFAQWLTGELGHLAYICTQRDLEESGWVTPATVAIDDYVPDFYLIWHRDYVGYDRRTAKPHHLKLIGQHGSITDRETRIPLVKFGAF